MISSEVLFGICTEGLGGGGGSHEIKLRMAYLQDQNKPRTSRIRRGSATLSTAMFNHIMYKGQFIWNFKIRIINRNFQRALH
jgi:hypothetical protein